MANFETLLTINSPANADLSAGQYLIVVQNSSGKVAVAGAGAAGIGILQDKPAAADRPATVGIFGRSKCVAGGTIASGAKFAADAAGKAVTAVSTANVMGTVLIGGVANDVIEVLLGVAPPILV